MSTSRLQVGEYFVLGEFADKRGGGLPPAASHVPIARLCCHLLDPLRREFGIVRVNSGFRTPASNQQVGGAKESRHLYDTFPMTPAADVTCETGTPREWRDFLNQLMPHTGGIGLYRGHVHVDKRPTRARWSG